MRENTCWRRVQLPADVGSHVDKEGRRTVRSPRRIAHEAEDARGLGRLVDGDKTSVVQRDALWGVALVSMWGRRRPSPHHVSEAALQTSRIECGRALQTRGGFSICPARASQKPKRAKSRLTKHDAGSLMNNWIGAHRWESADDASLTPAGSASRSTAAPAPATAAPPPPPSPAPPPAAPLPPPPCRLLPPLSPPPPPPVAAYSAAKLSSAVSAATIAAAARAIARSAFPTRCRLRKPESGPRPEPKPECSSCWPACRS